MVTEGAKVHPKTLGSINHNFQRSRWANTVRKIIIGDINNIEQERSIDCLCIGSNDNDDAG